MSYNAWGKWADMLRTLPTIRSAVPAPQYAFYEAKALAGLGQLDEALETVRPFADDPDTPAWLYWGQLADVFHTARLGDRAIECSEKAVEHAPDNPTVLLDLAMSRLRYRRDTARAGPCWNRPERTRSATCSARSCVMAEGVLALEEGRPENARELLDEAARLAEPLRHTTALMGRGHRPHSHVPDAGLRGDRRPRGGRGPLPDRRAPAAGVRDERPDRAVPGGSRAPGVGRPVRPNRSRGTERPRAQRRGVSGPDSPFSPGRGRQSGPLTPLAKPRSVRGSDQFG